MISIWHQLEKNQFAMVILRPFICGGREDHWQASARAVLFARLVNDPGYERNLQRGVNKKKRT